MATEADVRLIALALPEVIEKPWFNSPGFRVKDKGFLRIRSEAEGWLVVFVADLDEKEALLASDPDKFHTTPPPRRLPDRARRPGGGGRGRAHQLICDAWRAKAPKRVLQAHEGDLPV